METNNLIISSPALKILLSILVADNHFINIAPHRMRLSLSEVKFVPRTNQRFVQIEIIQL